jgi:hypothetical protein
VRFLPEILTSEKHPHGELAFPPDGKSVFWAAMLQDGPEQTIFHSSFDGITLSRPDRSTCPLDPSTSCESIDHLGDQIHSPERDFSSLRKRESLL